jgi:virginiamycin B lyase
MSAISPAGRLSAARARAVWPWLVVLLASLTVTGVAWGVAQRAPADYAEYAMLARGDIPAAVALGSGGDIWFSIENSDALGVLRDGRIQRVARGRESLEPLGLGVAGDGSIWFTDALGDAIGHINVDGSRESFPLPTPVTQFGRLAVASDGAVWVADSWSNSLVRFRDGEFTVFPASSGGAAPFGVAADADGGVWATYQVANKLVHVDAAGQIVEIEPPTRSSGPTDIAVDANGAVWVVELRAGAIARYDPATRGFSEYRLPHPQSGVTDLAVGPDGGVWFPELRAQKLGRLRDGVFREMALPRSDARPFGIRVDARGNVWYTDLAGWLGMLPAADASSSGVLELWRLFAWPRG